MFLGDAAALSLNLSNGHTDSLVEDESPWSAPGARPPFRDHRLHWCGSRNGYVSVEESLERY